MNNNAINNIINRIALSNNEKHPTASLYTGQGGLIILNALLYCNTNESVYYNRLKDLLQEFPGLIPRTIQHSDYSLCSGYTGVLWLISFLKKRKLLESNHINQFILEKETEIIKSLQHDKEKKEYDLFYGMIGKGIYFIDSSPNSKKTKDIITLIVNYLFEIAEETKNGICWQDLYYYNKFGNRNVYNYGYCHGVPSVIYFVCLVIKSNLYSNIQFLKNKLENIISWLINQEKPIGKSLFPNANVSVEQSRIGWCYGDLGVSYSLFLAADILQSEIIYNKALEIALYTNQRDICDTNIGIYQDFYDVGMCHGLPGISLMYKYFYLSTNLIVFKNKADYYYKLLIKSSNTLLDVRENIDSLNNPDLKDICNNNSLLKGTSGAALALLAYSKKNYNLNWVRLFQLK